MYISQTIALVALAFGLASAAQWNTEAREPLHYTFSNDKSLDVDNITGTIKIVGDGGNTIRVEGEKIIRAASQQDADRAKNEVKLDVSEKDGVARLYVNGPFRGHSNSDDHRYEVTYNFNIHVPRETELRLRDVNGAVETDQTNGNFDIHGVNGAVTMTAAAGSGDVRTVNGRLTVSFRENPKGPVDFQTVNGAIDAAFPPGLSADLRLSTLNGQAYTDFDTTAMASSGGTAERKNGKFVFKPDRLTRVRVGSGGPELKFETVNGAIHIRKETSK
jgi:hypothetical protein